MGKRILKICHKYGLFYFAVLGTAELTLYSLIRNAVLSRNDGTPFIQSLYVHTFNLIAIILIVLWILGYALYLFNIIYRKKTGRRSLLIDSNRFKMGLFETYRFFSKANPFEVDTKPFKAEDWKQAEGVLFGYSGKKLIKLTSDSEANIFVCGSPGSAKTTSQVIPSAAQFAGSVLAVDIKGDIYAHNSGKRPIRRFAPDIPDAASLSAHYNPFYGFDQLSESELKLRVASMSMILLPDLGEKEPYFRNTARKLFCGILLYLLSLVPNLTFPEFLSAVLHGTPPAQFPLPHFPKSIFDWIETICYDTAHLCPAAKEQVVGLLGNNEKNISGVFDNLTSALVPFSNPVLNTLLDGTEECITPADLESGSDVYLQISQNNLEVYAPLFTLIISDFLHHLANRPDSSAYRFNRPVLVILDEFPQLTFPYQTINQFLSTLRSKNVLMMIVCQSVSQLAKKYDNFGYQALLGNCTYQVCCRSNDELTKQHFINLIGTKRSLRRNRSAGKVSAQEIQIPVFAPEEYGNLTENAIVYFNGENIKVRKIKSYL